ncbi:MAG: hypothetical protein ABI655_08885 [Phenylobacterium sp.]
MSGSQFSCHPGRPAGETRDPGANARRFSLRRRLRRCDALPWPLGPGSPLRCGRDDRFLWVTMLGEP